MRQSNEALNVDAVPAAGHPSGYVRIKRIRDTLRVNLSAPAIVPDGHQLKNGPLYEQEEWVELKRRGEHVFVGRKRLGVHRSRVQQSLAETIRSIAGRECHPNILDALCQHPEFVPEALKSGTICFTAVQFDHRHRTHQLGHVRAIRFDCGPTPLRQTVWLGGTFDGVVSIAVIGS